MTDITVSETIAPGFPRDKIDHILIYLTTVRFFST